MTTRREAAKRFEEDIDDAGVPPQDNQDPPQYHAPQGYQDSINLPAMTDGEIRFTFINLVQSMTTQDEGVATPY